MANRKNGFLAGFIAAAVLSVMVVAGTIIGVMPEFKVVDMLSMMMGAPLIVGWLAQFMTGTLASGGGFSVRHGLIPARNAAVKGIASGAAAWLAELIACNLTDFKMHFHFSGPARLHLIPHINAPVADLPVLSVVDGRHFKADLTLPYGRIVHNYLA